MVVPCTFGSTAIDTDRPTIELVHAALCAKEIYFLLAEHYLVLSIVSIESVADHDTGKQVVCQWAKDNHLEYDMEIDTFVGVADVLVYGEDIGIFEIGYTKPSKVVLLARFIAKQARPYSIHLWPYGPRAFILRNWFIREGVDPIRKFSIKL